MTSCSLSSYSDSAFSVSSNKESFVSSYISETTFESSKISNENSDGDNMFIYINNNRLEAELENNISVTALLDKLINEDIVFTVNDYGGFEKVGALGFSLPTVDTYYDAIPGNIILYQGNNITFMYGYNSWTYTKIGHIKGYNETELRSLLCAGLGRIEVRLSNK